MIKRLFTVVLASLFLITGARTANASPSVCQSFESFYGIACAFNAEGLQASGMVSRVNLLTAWVITTMLSSMITGQRRLVSGFPDQTGMPAQAGGSRWNGWLGATHGEMANKFLPANSSGHANAFLGGLDYTFGNNLVVGLALSTDNTKMHTPYNGGNFESEGFTLAPYVAYPLSRSLLLDASIGFGSADLRSNSTIPFAILNAKSVDDRWFGAVSLSHITPIDKWLITLKGSLLHSEDKVKAFTAPAIVGPIGMPDTARLTQLRFGAQAAYDMGNGFQPYAGLAYINDTQREAQPAVGGLVPANDRDAWNFTVGLNFLGKGAVSGGLQLSTDMDRRETRNNQILGNIAVRF